MISGGIDGAASKGEGIMTRRDGNNIKENNGAKCSSASAIEGMTGMALALARYGGNNSAA